MTAKKKPAQDPGAKLKPDPEIPVSYEIDPDLPFEVQAKKARGYGLKTQYGQALALDAILKKMGA